MATASFVTSEVCRPENQVRVVHITLRSRTHPPDGTVDRGSLAKPSAAYCAPSASRCSGLTSTTTMAEQAAKRQKLETAVEPLIGTHDGTFHCDEALAFSLLRKTAAFEHSRE